MKSTAAIPNPTGHPARFSGAIIERLRDALLSDYPAPDPAGSVKHRPFVFDPFAGTGERLAELLGDEFEGGGIELYREFIVASQLVKVGDATRARFYPNQRFVVVTSPVYPNGMAESWNVNVADTSKRNTYRAALDALRANEPTLELDGHEFMPNDMGVLGYRGTKRGGRSVKRAAYWELAGEAVRQWTDNEHCEAVYLNVSDFMSGGEVEPFVEDWRNLLRARGWRIFANLPVRTPRHKGNDNADQRVNSERIIVAARPLLDG